VAQRPKRITAIETLAKRPKLFIRITQCQTSVVFGVVPVPCVGALEVARGAEDKASPAGSRNIFEGPVLILDGRGCRQRVVALNHQGSPEAISRCTRASSRSGRRTTWRPWQMIKFSCSSWVMCSAVFCREAHTS